MTHFIVKVASALTFALCVTGVSYAQSRTMQTIWVVQPTQVPTEELSLAGGDYVLKQRLLPVGLAELGTDATVGKSIVPAGTQLVEVLTEGAKIFCASEPGKKTLLVSFIQPCFIDADSDGSFDGWFRAVSQTKGLLTIGGNCPKSPRPLGSTKYRRVSPDTMIESYFVAIERRNFFNIYSSETFAIAFGREGSVERITSPISFKSGEMPKTLTIMGAQFSALEERNGKMMIKVERAMPKQPFGIVTTTSYRFY